MYIDYSTWEEFDYKVSSLHLDINNPRIKYRGIPLNQTQIIDFLIKSEKVYELAKKISEEGYFVGEAPIICIENDKKVVLEGNRRTAALKILQNPNKYLSKVRANVLLKNILKNNIPTNRKLRCFISPNRLLANPIIYSRHNGLSLERWKTGNQYLFVAEMYYEDGLSIEDICDVLNETKSKVIKPLKAYNLFLEGQDVLNREVNIQIDIATFDFTNLERFFNYDDARKLLGIDFNEENGELIITISREEFEKRVLVIFKRLIDAERFSRDFNRDEQKKEYVKDLSENSDFDFSTIDTQAKSSQSKSSIDKVTLDEKKNNTTTRRKQNPLKRSFENSIISSECLISFENDKLDDLFSELKSLTIDKKYSFAILLRSYLEQVLFHYVSEKNLFAAVGLKLNQEKRESGLAKVKVLNSYVKGKYNISENLNAEDIMKILKFTGDKDYSSLSLKIMLDYIKNIELAKFQLEANILKNIKQYIDNVKNELDLAVHNLNFIIDTTHNKRAWSQLLPLFELLSKDLLNMQEN
ncbi:hypothetical protein [Pedobacter sp. AJM]|uniref:hypothetical protein n=1 Tax=Pedobacter sp. AJM TaxID=2003629 RepID=UPI000B4C0517|nr:hypothetical protein [Pedobacter sp. AJM]OWK69212.1 hypothetical protein CBW18_18145 [Pedobacter sp. AJM]